MRKSTKFGLILGAVHTLPVSIALLMILIGSGGYTQPLWESLLVTDFPARLLLAFVPTLTKGISIYLAILFGIVGGIWWFVIGWSIAWTHGRLANSAPKARFISGFVILFVVILMVLVAQFVAGIDKYAAGSCISVGFPVPFFRGCSGTLSLYWPAMTVTSNALATDAFVWLMSATLFSFYLSNRWKQATETGTH